MILWCCKVQFLISECEFSKIGSHLSSWHFLITNTWQKFKHKDWPMTADEFDFQKKKLRSSSSSTFHRRQQWLPSSFTQVPFLNLLNIYLAHWAKKIVKLIWFAYSCILHKKFRVIQEYKFNFTKKVKNNEFCCFFKINSSMWYFLHDSRRYDEIR